MARPSAAATAAYMRLGTDQEQPGDAELWAEAWEAADPAFRKGYLGALDALNASISPDEPETRH